MVACQSTRLGIKHTKRWDDEQWPGGRGGGATKVLSTIRSPNGACRFWSACPLTRLRGPMRAGERGSAGHLSWATDHLPLCHW